MLSVMVCFFLLNLACTSSSSTLAGNTTCSSYALRLTVLCVTIRMSVDVTVASTSALDDCTTKGQQQKQSGEPRAD